MSYSAHPIPDDLLYQEVQILRAIRKNGSLLLREVYNLGYLEPYDVKLAVNTRLHKYLKIV